MAVGFVASATSGSQASVASFNIGTLGTGARAGIVFVAIHNSATDIITGVTWNGVAMNVLYSATDTDTEPGVVKAYFLDNVTNGTITVSRTNNAVITVGYAASISGASTGLEAYQTITRVSSTQNTNANTSTTGTGTSGEVAVDDGSPGTNSMRFSAAYSGGATPPLQGTNSTNLQVLDSTALGSRFVRETTAGQGSRNVGFATGTTDDWALVAVAVREIPPVVSLPTAAALVLTGDTPTVLAPALSQPTAGAMTLAGATPTIHANPTITFACGWEDAAVTTHWEDTGGVSSLDSSIAGRTGTNALRLALTNSAVQQMVLNAPGLRAVIVRTFRFRVSALPTGNTRIAMFEGTVYDSHIQLASSGTLIFTAGGTSANSTNPIVANTWYRVDVAVDGTNMIARWSIDGVAQTNPGAAGSTQTINATYFGKSNFTATGAFSLYVDDYAISETWGDYPIGPGTVTKPASTEVWNVGLPATSEPTAASLVLAGDTPVVTATDHKTAEPTAAALVITGAVPDVVAGTSDNKTAVPDAAALTLTGATPAVSAAQAYDPTVAALTLTGATPTVTAPQAYVPTAAPLTLSGATPTVTTPVVSLPSAVNLVMTGATPTVSTTQNQNIVPGPLGLTLTGSVPDVIATGATTGGHHGSSVRRGRIRPVTIPPEVVRDDDELFVLGVL